MISLQTIATAIENKLNTAASLTEYKFIVHAGTGKWTPARRTENDIQEYVNCVLSVLASDKMTTVGGQVLATQTMYLRIIVKLTDDEEDGSLITIDFDGTETESQRYKGNVTKINEVRELINSAFQPNDLSVIEENNESFTVSAVYQLLGDGERRNEPSIGNSYTFSMNIFYSFVENGINVVDTAFVLDGIEIPYQTMTISRLPTMDGNVPASGTGKIENLSSQSGITFNFELPALKDTATKSFLSVLLGGTLNEAHILTVKFGEFTEPKSYLVTLSEIQAMGEIIKNVGQRIAFVPTAKDYDLVEIPDSYYIYDLGANAGAGEAISVIGQAFCFGSDKFVYGTEKSHAEYIPTAADGVVISTTALAGLTPLKEPSNGNI